MNFYLAKTPTEYQELFHHQIGLSYTKKEMEYRIWENSKTGFIRSFGYVDTIQSGVANYSIPNDFMVEHRYNEHFLHFGIVFDGITYSMVEDKMITNSVPSSFLIIRNNNNGIDIWRKGQHFKGTEITIEMNYLKNKLLPFLGFPTDALLFFEENVDYTNLPEEMCTLILRMEELINTNRITEALQTSLCLEFIALLLHPDTKKLFLIKEKSFGIKIQMGKRQIRLTENDYKKIKNAHERIRLNTDSFLTISVLSRELQISEQKLKVGFQEIYKQTIWDYSNTVRMNQAVSLLHNTDKSVLEISKQIGYQSQAAFIRMFKKWCGVTPGQFRLQMIDNR